MKKLQNLKSGRILAIYARLQAGRVLNKADLAREFGVNERSIQRDIEDLRDFLAEEKLGQTVVYDKRARGYCLNRAGDDSLSNSEILAVCKILLESRSLRHDEMLPILDKLVECCVPEPNKATVRELLANEKYHYIAPHHDTPLLPRLWELGQAVRTHRVIEVEYARMTGEVVRRELEPVGLMFSEYYFYLVAYVHNIEQADDLQNPDNDYPTIYRVDRIRNLKVRAEHFHPGYAARFEEGEFRKRVQFMFGGKLQRVTFDYSGPSVEAVLDRLPTAKIIDRRGGVYTVQAEVFGRGIEMWLNSQGDYVSNVKYM